MNEERRIKQTLIRNTTLFFVVFALIFAALGLFTYSMVKDNMYRSADTQLNGVEYMYPLADASALEYYGSLGEAQEDNTSADASSTSITPLGDAGTGTDALGELNTDKGSNPNPDASGETSTSAAITTQSIEASLQDNPQTIFVFRDANGKMGDVLNLYPGYQDFVQDLTFNAENIDTIYDIELNGHYYRGITRNIETGNSVSTFAPTTSAITDGSPVDISNQPAEWHYLQIIVNVDSEIVMLEQFTQTLIIALVMALIVCAAASYLLSRKTTRPIVQAWKKQTEFVQNASHELRTPLTVIHATQELLLEKPHDKIIDHLEDISLTLEETERLSKLAEELMMLTSIDSGTLKFSKDQVNLDQLLEDTVALFEDYAQCQDKLLVLNLEHCGTVETDRDRIRQVLHALLGNAFKYTAAGDTITVRSSRCGSKSSFSVADTGIGITEEDKNHLFDRFYRADKARTRTDEGAGLGLSITKSLVEGLGGTVVIGSREPKGTIVTVTLSH